MKTIKGIIHNIESDILVRAQRNSSIFAPVGVLGKYPSFLSRGNVAILSDNVATAPNKKAIVIAEAEYNTLSEGDILYISPNGTISVLWDMTNLDNCLYLTDHCNSSCIMCPQKPEGECHHYYDLAAQILNLAERSPKISAIGISGGEPTMIKDRFIDILKICDNKFPSVPIQCLTNGKNFDDFDFAKECVLANQHITFCIPLYASYPQKHDSIVGSQGSFNRTINGIYNLIRLRSYIEIRVVILKHNYDELPLLMDYIYQNLSFVDHIAIMGMETSGYAKDNIDDVWIDPYEYRQCLIDATRILKRSRMKFSFFNMPRCILPRPLWGYDADSISPWKKSYGDKCTSCSEKDNCCGLFATSVRHSDHIEPIV